jgi:hypothetical protein
VFVYVGAGEYGVEEYGAGDVEADLPKLLNQLLKFEKPDTILSLAFSPY